MAVINDHFNKKFLILQKTPYYCTGNRLISSILYLSMQLISFSQIHSRKLKEFH
jgi:hypothetical protein